MPPPGTSATFVSGRMPWYSMSGELKHPYLIGIAGGSASGKTTVSQRILRSIGNQVALISMDSFYKPLSSDDIRRAHQNDYNFDRPSSFDNDLLFECLQKLKLGKSAEIPVYDFSTHTRVDNKTTYIYGANVVIFEGIFALCDKNVRDLMDLKIFVDTDSDVRLARRLKRDISECGRDVSGVLQQYHKFVKPAFDDHVFPTMTHADVIIPRGKENLVAIDLISKHILRQLEKRGMSFRNLLAEQNYGNELPNNVLVMEPRGQLKALHTIIRDRDTSLNDFIFYSERLSCLVVERALAELPHTNVDILTPTNYLFKGVELQHQICGVSIIRSGATMEAGLRRVSKDCSIGKLLIQTSQSTGEPALHYCKLPSDIAQRHVLVMDATIATGAAAMMAIRVLKDHDVSEDRIVFCSLIVAPPGAHAIARAFPKVKIVTSEIDPTINELYHILPGIGNYGDRYFGT